jgi:MFS family permease
VLRASSAPAGVKLDLPGAASVTLGLLALIYGVTSANPYMLIGGLALLALFFVIEWRAKAPLVAVSILARPTVKWGNLAALVVFSMEPALIFLTTLYLQDALHLSPLDTGLIFGIPGLSSIIAGIIAGRIIARRGVRSVLAIGLLVQAGFTAPLLLLGPDPVWLWVLVPALFVGFFGHVTAIVASMVTATSGVADSEQGLATGLVSMTQQVGITIGIPIFAAIAATQAGIIPGMHLALAVNVVLTGLTVILVWVGLRPRPTSPTMRNVEAAQA